MKNLVLVHLESLNYALFMRFPELFPTLHQLKNKGQFYNHYFTTATSTLMVIGDIVYGGKEQYEVCSSLDYIPRTFFYNKSIFDDLKERGYNTGLFVYPDGGDRESAEMRHIAGFNNEMVLKPRYDEFMEAIDELVTNEPFAIMACNYISNLSFNRYADCDDVLDGTDRWKRGYQYLDRYVQDIIDILERKQQLDNTCIILYGDHGDDYWGHGMHGGLTHATEPYATLIHTPLIVLDKGIKAGLNENIICATDLKTFIENRLEFHKWKEIKNEYIIARSSYAAQPVRKDTFNKAYSITDGKFLLLVSTNGLELYDIEMDFQCDFNFLQLFVIEEGILKYDEEKNKKLRFHYGDFMSEAEKLRLRQRAYYLKRRLYEEVLNLYVIAGRTESDMNDEMNFDKIHNNG